MGVELEYFADDAALALAVAERWRKMLETAGREGRSHSVALSGGRISARVFATMAELSREGGLDPSPARIFWADERAVPPDHPDSNYRAARIDLLEPLAIPAEHIHRIRGELPPADAAAAAAAELRAVADGRLDLVLLGMGEDGHVASLFPGHEPELADESSLFLPVSNSPKPPPLRVTLGMGPLIRAHEVWVLVTGSGKDQALHESLAAGGTTPLARLLRRRTTTRILTTIRPLTDSEDETAKHAKIEE